MKKLFIMLVGMFLIASCGGGGGGDRQEPSAKYDATGAWLFETNSYYTECNGSNDYKDTCEQCGTILSEELSKLEQVSIVQNGIKFSITMGSEKYNGEVDYKTYTFSGKEEDKIDGIKITIKWYATINLENVDYFTGVIEYDIYAEDFYCSVRINIQGWREGVFDPILKIEPEPYHDFGVIAYTESASVEFTITNIGHPDYAEALCLTKQGFIGDTHYFSWDWDLSDQVDYIPRGESRSFTIVYEPQTWDEEHFSTFTFETNDANMPELIIELTGTATTELPVVNVSSVDACDCPQSEYPSDLCVCFEDMEMCSGESEPKSIIFTNDGNIELTISNDGSDNRCNFSLFSEDGEEINQQSWDATLQAGESVELTAEFHPVNDDYHNYCFTFNTNDPNKKNVMVRLYGQGIYVTPYPHCWDVYCPESL